MKKDQHIFLEKIKKMFNSFILSIFLIDIVWQTSKRISHLFITTVLQTEMSHMTGTNGTLMKEADIGNIFTFWAIDLENNPELYNLICLIHLHTPISKFYNLVFVEAKSCNIKISPRGKKKHMASQHSEIISTSLKS